METAILVFGAYVALVAFLGSLLAKAAPPGFEDDEGFHRGEEPVVPRSAADQWHLGAL
jgi:hypothetical protein